LKKFILIYGCGSATANRFYELGYRSIQEIRDNRSVLSEKAGISFDRIKYGIAYYADLSERVTTDEANRIFETIKRIVLDVNDEFIVTLVGGFRRLAFCQS
jgi:hypothetical protein